ncbi:hypothetical protein [Neobacillus paridis]|uniref:hypothetical protein n=1 Tax=Neobacillus paridis TaxID=2803862 RepID=UPI001F38060C|nr:hypothetical protein [Neobacillus paridis]
MPTFQDIPQMTVFSGYQVNIPLRYLEKRVKEDMEELGLQLESDFQRGHVWTEYQQIKFVEYLFRGGKSNRTLYFNHPGWNSNLKGDRLATAHCLPPLSSK